MWPGATIDLPAVWRAERGRWESPDGRFYFDMAAADRAVDFFPDLLRHYMGELKGQPFELLDYQKKLLTRPLFGWKRADGIRRFSTVFAFLPKGAGKSPWAAGTGLYLVRCDGEFGAEVYAVATDRNQARTVHTNAKYMVEDSPYLLDGAEILKDSIYWADTRSTFIVLSSDASSAHGKRPHGIIFDELHGFSGERYRELYEALKKSMIKRRQPLLIMITHSGTDDESLCFEEYEYAKAVLSGTIQDDAFLPVVFEADPSDDWASPEVHRRVNPGYGVTVRPDGVEQECLEARNDPRKRNDFLRYHLNRWVNQATAWIPVDWWDAASDPIPDDAILRGLPCACGLDLAQKIDLACFLVAFRARLDSSIAVRVAGIEGQPEPVTMQLNYRLIVLPFFWIPENTMRLREQEDRVPYSEWQRLGLVTATEGDIIDYDRIYQDITTRIAVRFPRIKEGGVGYDPAFATDLATNLRDAAGFRVEEVLQNYRFMNEPCQMLEGLIKAKRVTHGGHRVLRNHIENVAVKTDDAGRIRPVKPRRSGKHIDGVVALLDAIRMLSVTPDRPDEPQMFFLGR